MVFPSCCALPDGPAHEGQVHECLTCGCRYGVLEGVWVATLRPSLFRDLTGQELPRYADAVTVLPEHVEPIQQVRQTPCSHGESLWGRCAACGMTWGEQERQQKEREQPFEQTLDEDERHDR